MTEQLGRYEIFDQIGQGGFAIVYRGRDTELDRLVALKELKPTLIQDSSWVERFRREARTIARLDHPYIVPIYDVYETQHRLFIIMRLIDGVSLEDTINNEGRLPWAQTVEIITRVADGLDYAHSNGVLHRDLKPANILIDFERGPLLSDFGLAKLTGEHSMSASGSVVGTPHYIAPEVWEGQTATNRSDIYALGCILCEMLTGEKVFKGETPPAVMMAHFAPLVLPDTWPEDVPVGIKDVLATTLARKPGDRYEKANQLAEALAALTTDGQVESNHSTSRDVDQTDEIEVSTAVQAEQDMGEPQALDSASDQAVSQHQASAPALSASQPVAEQGGMPAQQAQVQQPSVSQPPYGPIGWQRRRPGCFLTTTIVVIGLVLIVAISAATFCSTITGAFRNAFPTADAAVADIFTNAFPTVQVGSTTSEDIHIPIPDSSDTINLEIIFGPGELIIEPGATDGLLEGAATYNTEQLKPITITNGNDIRLEPETGIGLTGFTRQDIKNRWDLKLASIPMELTIDAGIGEGKIELGGLSLINLSVSRTLLTPSNFDLSFSEPNRFEMETLRFESGASVATLSGLANARAEEIIFKGGPGSYTLDFSGDLQRNLKVSIGGADGDLIIIVPEGTATQLSVQGGALQINERGAWQETDNDLYTVPGEGYTITIDLTMNSGTLNLRN